MPSNEEKTTCDEELQPATRHPSPTDFDNFLPWACSVFQVKKVVHIHKEVRRALSTMDHSKQKSKGKKIQSTIDVTESKKSSDPSVSSQFMNLKSELIYINAIYHGEHLFQLKFGKNTCLPRILFVIIGLVIKHYQHLNSVTINSGLDMYCIHEIAKILPHSNITDLCLDGTFLLEANYYVLLDNPGRLRYLSLSRCNINDQVVQRIAQRLISPLPASKTICVLNLSSNWITDIGANYIAEMLRSNRQISYLNLAGNMLKDEGAYSILNILKEFPITNEEIKESKVIQLAYIKEKHELIEKILFELREAKSDKKIQKGKIAIKKSKDSKADETVDVEEVLHQKASNMAINNLGELKDPFSPENTISKNHVLYCQGNNALCYLNLAYNNLSPFTIRKLVDVLNYQRYSNRSPIGLINVSIEGNPIPDDCNELKELAVIIEIGLMSFHGPLAMVRKRALSKKFK